MNVASKIENKLVQTSVRPTFARRYARESSFEKSRPHPYLPNQPPNDTKPPNATSFNNPPEPPKPNQISTKNNPYARPNPGKCFRCNQPGHRFNECPQRRQANLVDEVYDEEYAVEEVSYEEEALVKPNEGDAVSCIIQKFLLAP